jgi:hypothetical protein
MSSASKAVSAASRESLNIDYRRMFAGLSPLSRTRQTEKDATAESNIAGRSPVSDNQLANDSSSALREIVLAKPGAGLACGTAHDIWL